MARIRCLEAIAAGMQQFVVAGHAAVPFVGHQSGGGAAPVAGQPRHGGHQPPAGGSAVRTGAAQPPHQPEGQSAEAGHAGWVEVGAHVGLHQGQAVNGVGKCPFDGLLQVVEADDALAQAWRGGTVLAGTAGAHDQAMVRKAHLSQPAVEVGNTGHPPLAEVGGGVHQLFAHHQPLAGINQGEPFVAQRQQRHGGVGAEAALAGDAQVQVEFGHGGFGLAATGCGGIGGAFAFAAEGAEAVGVEGCRQLQREA